MNYAFTQVTNQSRNEWKAVGWKPNAHTAFFCSGTDIKQGNTATPTISFWSTQWLPDRKHDYFRYSAVVPCFLFVCLFFVVVFFLFCFYFFRFVFVFVCLFVWLIFCFCFCFVLFYFVLFFVLFLCVLFFVLFCFFNSNKWNKGPPWSRSKKKLFY